MTKLAKKAMAEFYPKEALDPYRIEGIDIAMDDAVALKFLNEPLTKDQLAEFFQVPARKK
jgi:NitT/TauT family transport system substrate-binding protein